MRGLGAIGRLASPERFVRGCAIVPAGRRGRFVASEETWGADVAAGADAGLGLLGDAERLVRAKDLGRSARGLRRDEARAGWAMRSRAAWWG
jgi:hypothetical protein